MKRCLVTGGTGFVGANLVRRLLKDGHEVHLFVRPQHAAWRLEGIRKDVRLHTMDMADAQAVVNTVSEIKPDWIFHLAAHGAYSWQTDIAQIFQTNLISTIHLVEACLKTGFESFIHTGSSSEYGYKENPPTETTFVEPNSHYAVAKASATLYCRYTAQARQANITTLRLYSAFGPYEDAKRLMPTLIRHGLQGEWPPLVNPDTARDFIYVEDVCDACLLTAQLKPRELGQVFNLGTGKQTAMREVVEIARRLMDIQSEPHWGSMPARKWDTSNWCSDSRKIQGELAWHPKFDFEAGLAKMIAWQREQPA